MIINKSNNFPTCSLPGLETPGSVGRTIWNHQVYPAGIWKASKCTFSLSHLSRLIFRWNQSCLAVMSFIPCWQSQANSVRFRRRYFVGFATREKYAWSYFPAGTERYASMLRPLALAYSIFSNAHFSLLLNRGYHFSLLYRSCAEKCKRCPICRNPIEERLAVYDV